MVIANSKMPQILEIIRKLENSPIKFYLTGSRFFSTHDENSDWDFFTLDSLDARNFLKNIGFVKTSDSTYETDPLIDTIYMHTEANIHVQIVKDVELKNAVQERLRYVADLDPDLVPLKNKREMSKIWKLLIKFCQNWP